MKLLVILLCLFSERFLMHSLSYHRFSWFDQYCLSVKNALATRNLLTSPALLLAFIAIPIPLLAFIIYMLFQNLLFGLIGLLFNIAVLFYCIGPQNPFYPENTESSPEPAAVVIGAYFSAVNTQLFAVIFWYVIAGPIAALFYRLITLSQHTPGVDAWAQRSTDILEWIPARLSAFLYLLVGNFQSGLKPFTRLALASPEQNHQLLSECGLHALRTGESDDGKMPAAETLIEHALIVLLVCLAFFTLAAYL